MGKMDLWYGFACHGIDLLCQSGHLCFIAQNNWTTSAGAKKMRNKIVEDARVRQMLDFNTYIVFENADIQTMIMLFEKNQTTDNFEIDYHILMEGATKEDMLALLNKQIHRTIYRTQKFSRSKYANNLFTFSDNELIFDKISENKTYLQNDEATNGIHTHHNCVNNKIHRQFPDLEVGKGIFVLSSEEKESLNLTTGEESLIKPFFSSDEIFRFYTSNKNKSWIIYTDSQYKIFIVWINIHILKSIWILWERLLPLITDLMDCIEQEKVDFLQAKICDPAIGSGAFPMGLLRELFFCRSAIEPNITEYAADIKRYIIQNNIYGVDIERGAVDIARLRFWLALIVDEKTPEALPNLDFKIMQGNSLLEQYKGVDLSTMTEKKVGAGQSITIFDSMLDVYRKNLRDKLAEYYACPEHDKKVQLRKEIADIVKRELVEQGIHIDFEDMDLSANSQFFLWHTWFHDVFSRPSKEGFDIVIGNPPYGAKYDNQTKRYYKNTYVTANSIHGLQKGSLDTYTLFIELGYNLLRRDGSFAYIVPISLTSSDSLTGTHRILMGNCDTIRISSYAVRPKPVFENAVVNTSILLFQKTETPCQHLFSTKMHRRGNEFDLQELIDNLQFIDVKGQTLYGRIPKIGSIIEKTILNKLFKQTKLGSFVKTSGSPIIYRFAGGRYFKVVINYSNGSSAERTIYFANSKIADAVGCIISSNLSFWFYQIFSDNLNWKSYEIENFAIPQLSTENIEYLCNLYSRYLTDIEAKANVRTTSVESTYNVDSFKEYKIVRSKTIIDEIDDYIGPLYGLTQEEIDFIKNYELEFRMAGE